MPDEALALELAAQELIDRAEQENEALALKLRGLSAPARFPVQNEVKTMLNKPVRRAVIVAEPKDEKITTLAQKAQSLLGYSVLHDELAGQLAHVLAELEIEIMTLTTVKEYQKNLAMRASVRGLIEGQEATWSRTAIADYKEPIPEFVLNKAVQIKEHLPEVEVFVEHMNTRVIPDPFLIVKLGREEFAVEVWEEPKFEGRVTK